MKFSLTILTIIVILLPTVSSGFGGRSYQDGMFWGVDLDRNERIDRYEAKNAYNLANDEVFARFDKNGNGSINQIEFNEFIQQAPWTDRFIHPHDKA